MYRSDRTTGILARLCKQNFDCFFMSISRAGKQNEFHNGGAMEHWKVLPANTIGRQEQVLSSRRSSMAKTVIFWSWWQTFDGFCFENLFNLFASLFSKSVCVCVCGEAGRCEQREVPWLPRCSRPWFHCV